MKIGLNANFDTALHMYRAQQEDMTVSVAENLVEKELPDRLTQFLETAKTKPMVHRYEFASLESKILPPLVIFVFSNGNSSTCISRNYHWLPRCLRWNGSVFCHRSPAHGCSHPQEMGSQLGQTTDREAEQDGTTTCILWQ